MIDFTPYQELQQQLSQITTASPLPDATPEQISRWQQKLLSDPPLLTKAEWPEADALLAIQTLLQSHVKQELPLEELASCLAWAEKDNATELLAATAEKWQLPVAWLHLCLHLSWQWSLSRLTEHLSRHVQPESWISSTCPYCGGHPVGAELVKDGHRFLVCGTCFAKWRFARIRCSFCGQSDSEQLRTLDTADFPGWKILACQVCGGLLKTADRRELLQSPDWNQAQITLLPFELAAQRWSSKETSPC